MALNTHKSPNMQEVGSHHHKIWWRVKSFTLTNTLQGDYQKMTNDKMKK